MLFEKKGGFKEILQNLHRRFVLCSNSQINGGDFVAFSEYLNFIRKIAITYSCFVLFMNLKPHNLYYSSKHLSTLNVITVTKLDVIDTTYVR